MSKHIHLRIVATLHIVSGTLFLLALALIGPVIAAFGALGPSYGVDPDLAATVGGVGMLLVSLVALLSIAQIVGAVMLLRGSKAGHAMIIGFSVLGLLNVPVGTVAGIYCLWALLNEAPDLTPTAAVATAA